MDKEYTLITGASAGIGKELAYEFAREGYPLLLVARSEDKLKALADEIEEKFLVNTIVKKSDLSNDSGVEELIKYIKNEQIGLEHIVNNAGFGLSGRVNKLDLNEGQKMLRLNINALTRLTEFGIKHFIGENREGGILNVASTAAFQPVPFMSAYAATKSYVLSYSVGIREEVSDLGITVSCLCPGPTNTNFAARSGMKDGKNMDEIAMTPAKVARIGLSGFLNQKAIITPGLSNKYSSTLARLVPISWSAKIASKIFKKQAVKK